MSQNQRKAFLFAISAVLFWSTVGSAFKLSLSFVSPILLLLGASFVAILVLTIMITMTRNWGLIMRTNLSQVFHSAVLGFLNPFLYYVILLKAYQILKAQEAVVLNYTWPLVLTLLSIPLLRQKLSIKSLLAIGISFAGTVIVVTHGSLSLLKMADPFGAALALGSSLVWASFWIFNVRDTRDELNKLFFNFIFGFLYTLILAMVIEKPVIPPIQGIIGITYVGIFEMGLTFVLWLKALQLSSSAAKVTNLIYLSPFISLILVGLVVGEKIYPSTLVGLVFIIGGIVLQSFNTNKIRKLL